MEIARSHGGAVARVVLSGRMDSGGVQAEADRFRQMVIEPGKDVILDLSGLEFMTSVGMRLLIEAQKGLSAKGAKVVLAAPRVMVAEGLRIAGIDRLMDVTPDLDAARALFE